jgi:hypothetical protein
MGPQGGSVRIAPKRERQDLQTTLVPGLIGPTFFCGGGLCGEPAEAAPEMSPNATAAVSA